MIKMSMMMATLSMDRYESGHRHALSNCGELWYPDSNDLAPSHDRSTQSRTTGEDLSARSGPDCVLAGS